MAQKPVCHRGRNKRFFLRFKERTANPGSPSRPWTDISHLRLAEVSETATCDWQRSPRPLHVPPSVRRGVHSTLQSRITGVQYLVVKQYPSLHTLYYVIYVKFQKGVSDQPCHGLPMSNSGKRVDLFLQIKHLNKIYIFSKLKGCVQNWLVMSNTSNFQFVVFQVKKICEHLLKKVKRIRNP